MSLCRTGEEFCIGSHDREGSASVNFMNFVRTGAKLEIFVTIGDGKNGVHEKLQWMEGTGRAAGSSQCGDIHCTPEMETGILRM